jgi:hypothetical protein
MDARAMPVSIFVVGAAFLSDYHSRFHIDDESSINLAGVTDHIQIITTTVIMRDAVLIGAGSLESRLALADPRLLGAQLKSAQITLQMSI